jgi:hypothetical protein
MKLNKSGEFFMNQNDYVWYASYGSNINKDRFLCYIKGGTPIGSSIREIGCRDKSLPKDEKSFIIPHQIYFAKESRRWQRQGVAFIDLERSKKFKTYSRMYLVTKEQFFDIVSQENTISQFEVNLDDVIKKGSLVFRDTWYGHLLYIDEADGHPIFSFTSPYPLDPNKVKKPSDDYFKTIIIGLKNEMGLTNGQVFHYFSEVPGIVNRYTNEELEHLIVSAF